VSPSFWLLANPFVACRPSVCRLHSPHSQYFCTEVTSGPPSVADCQTLSAPLTALLKRRTRSNTSVYNVFVYCTPVPPNLCAAPHKCAAGAVEVRRGRMSEIKYFLW